MPFRFLLILLFIAAPEVFAGTWTSYVSHNDVRAIAFEGDYVWCGTTGGVVRWDKRDGSCLHLSIVDGLVSNDVRAIAVDKSGRKWCGTSAGASVYTGSGWTTYSSADGLVDNDVNVIEIGPDGKVWVGSDAGMSMFDGKGWTKWTSEDVPAYPEGKFTDLSSIAFGADGTVFCLAGSYDGRDHLLWQFDGVSWKHHANGGGHTVRVDSSGMLWCVYYAGMSEDFLITLPGDSTVYHEMPDFTPGYRTFTDFTIDRKDTVWLIRNHNINLSTAIDIVRYDGANWSVFTPVIGQNGAVFKEWMHVIRVDDEGTVWIGSERGLLRFDGSKWKIFLDGLAHNSAGNGTLDRDGVLWVISRGVVSSFDGIRWKPYGNDSDFLADYPVGSIIVDDLNVKWFGAEKGVVRFDGSTWSFLPYPESQPYEYSLMAVDHDGVLWFTYQKDRLAYAASYDGKQWTFYSNENLLSASGASMVVDRDNRKWFYTNKGLACFDGLTWTTHFFPHKEFSTGSVSAAYCDSGGNLWFGVESDLYRFDEQTWQAFDMSATETAWSITRDRNGVVWIGSWSGAERFDGEKWDLLTSADGLVSTPVYTVLADADNTKWFCTGAGVSAFSEIITGIAERSHPSSISLSTFPNPFNPSATIEFTLPQSGRTTLEVYSLSGQRIRTLVSGTMNAGGHSVIWDGLDERGRTVSSGVYFARIGVGEGSAVKKMLLLR